MGQFVMSFRGVTMHVTKESGVLPLNVKHRVVPINASAGYRGPVHDWGDVPAHFCFLEGAPDALDALGVLGLPAAQNYLLLQGWHVSLDNPASTNLDLRLQEAPRVPSMKDYLPGMKLKEGIGNEVQVPDWAAAFVDINSGTVTTAAFDEGAIYTTWSVETIGDPILRFTPTTDSGVQEAFPIGFPSTPPAAVLAHHVPGSLVMHNGTPDMTDKEFDFVLHFLANVNGVPMRSQLRKIFPIDPPSPSGSGLIGDISMTTSCSNSQFP